MKDPHTGGDIADHYTNTTNNLSIQELASADPSAIESSGPERSGAVVNVDIERAGLATLTFKLRFGLHAAGGEHV